MRACLISQLLHLFALSVAIAISLAASSSLAHAKQEFQDATNEGVDENPSPQERRSRQQSGGGGRRVYRDRVAANWISDSQFWYRNDLPEGQREFIFVDATEGTRDLAFDHAAVKQAFVGTEDADRMPIERLEYDDAGKLIGLVGKSKRYQWDATAKKLTEVNGDAADPSKTPSNGNNNPNRRPSRTGAETSVTFVNRLAGSAELFWVSDDGSKQSYGKVEPGKSRDQHTFGGHRWEIHNDKGESLGIVVADDNGSEVTIDGRKFEPAPTPRRRRDGNRTERNDGRSPDGKWTASVVDYNVVVNSTDSGESISLSDDGKEGLAYGQLIWSPDSQSLIAFRMETVQRKEFHIVRSSPPGGGRAVLQSQPYSLPGDDFPKYEPNIFHIQSRQQVKPTVDRYEHEWSSPRIRFSKDGTKFTYEQIDRGHSRFRLIEVDVKSGSVRNLVDEKSNTFIWTAHNENNTLRTINWLEKSNQLIYVTEKNGWRQFILLDANNGSEIRELTPRGIVCRSIEKIDEENRILWFTASGRAGPDRDGPDSEDQDPYFIHYAKVELDTGKVTWLTDGNGTHSIEFSPNGKYVLDSYSRVDMAPVTELRSAEDGRLLCKLERADISGLQANGWTAPEVFVTKGRDGKTDIWGIICRPKDYDPSKKYPVIEDIYAGPQDSFVPKNFSPSQRFESLTSLGFIVVKIDGMGTANRSKAFHDVCWKNLKDGGFEDRILWIKAAATKYPELDLSRVGIYGTSAGGQNAAGGVLFHPEFYKVAVAACGCHDNRMDKASWNEQWMGYPVGPHYGESSNIDNAYRLRGKLLLIVGEVDTNVPPESTLRFADALIRANKDFDLLVVPNSGHGMGGVYGTRRMHDYFVRQLLGQEPPDRNAE